MKSVKLIAFSCCLLWSMASCDPESAFTQVVELDIPTHEPKIALSCHIVAGDTSIQALVTSSSGILEPSIYYAMPGATVRLFKNGELLHELLYNDFYKRYVIDDIPPIADDGATYRLEASHPNFAETAYAEQTMPSSVPITETSYEPDGFVDGFGDRYNKVTLRFDDPASTGNYYALGIYVENYTGSGGISSSYYDYFETNDPILQEGGVASDASFNGKSYTFTIGTYFYPYEHSKVFVELRAITHDHFLYKRSYALYQDAHDNPFAEPVVVYNNIQNGYGIFSVASKSKKELVF
jgi:hypothetical protein